MFRLLSSPRLASVLSHARFRNTKKVIDADPFQVSSRWFVLPKTRKLSGK
jgi:hypothetical protein